MTSPDERLAAKTQAAAALDRAVKIRTRSDSIAARWRKSQQDNNFRQMLRVIGKGASSA